MRLPLYHRWMPQYIHYDSHFLRCCIVHHEQRFGVCHNVGITAGYVKQWGHQTEYKQVPGNHTRNAMCQKGETNLKVCKQDFLFPARDEGRLHWMQFVILCIGLLTLLVREKCTTNTDTDITAKTSIWSQISMQGCHLSICMNGLIAGQACMHRYSIKYNKFPWLTDVRHLCRISIMSVWLGGHSTRHSWMFV
jgi:hypothetical protein